MRGGRKLEMRQPRDALLGGSKDKGLACKEGSGRGLRLGGRQCSCYKESTRQAG